MTYVDRNLVDTALIEWQDRCDQAGIIPDAEACAELLATAPMAARAGDTPEYHYLKLCAGWRARGVPERIMIRGATVYWEAIDARKSAA